MQENRNALPLPRLLTSKLLWILICQLGLELPDAFEHLVEILLHVRQHLHVSLEVDSGVLKPLCRQGVTVGEHGVCLLKPLKPGRNDAIS